MIFNPIFIQDYSGSSQLKQNGLRFQSANYLFADIINVYENKSNANNPQLSLEQSIGKNLFSLDGKDIIKVSAEELISFFESFPGKLDVIDSDKTLTDKSVIGISDSKNISVNDLLNQIELKGKIEIVSSEQPDKILLITINQIPEDKSDNKFLMNIKPHSSSIVSFAQDENSSNTVSELLNKLKLNYSRIKSEKKQIEDKDFAIINSSEKQELLALLNQIAEEIARDNSIKNSFLFSDIKEVLDEIKKELSTNTSPNFDETDEQANGMSANDLINVSGDSGNKNRVEKVFDNYKSAITFEYTSINSETKEQDFVAKPTIKYETHELKKGSDGTEFKNQGDEKTSSEIKNNFIKNEATDRKYEQGKVDDLRLNKIQPKEKPFGVELKINGSNQIKSQMVEKSIFIEKESEVDENQVTKNQESISETETARSQQVNSKVIDVDSSNVQLKEKPFEVKLKTNDKASSIETEIVVKKNSLKTETQTIKDEKTSSEIKNNFIKNEATDRKYEQGKVDDLRLNKIQPKEKPFEVEYKINKSNSIKAQTVEKRIFIEKESEAEENQATKNQEIISGTETIKSQQLDSKVLDVDSSNVQLNEKPVEVKTKANIKEAIEKPSIEKEIVLKKNTAVNEIQLKETENLLSEIEINNSRPAEEKEKNIPEKIIKNDLSKFQLKEQSVEFDSKIKTKIDLLINQIRNQERPDSKIKLSLDTQNNQFDKRIINKEIIVNRVIKKLVEANTKTSSMADFPKAKEVQKNSATANSDESKLKYSIHIIENAKVWKVSENNYKPSNNIPAEIKGIQIQKGYEEVNPNLTFSKKLSDYKNYDVSERQFEGTSKIENPMSDSDLKMHEVENNESITSLKEHENTKTFASDKQKSIKNILRTDEKNIHSKNSIEGRVSNNESSSKIDSKTVEDIPRTIENEVNIHQSSLSKNETTINNYEVKNYRKHVNESEDLHLSESNKNENNNIKPDGSKMHYDQQGRNNDKNTSDSVVRNLNVMNEKPLDFIRELKNNLENISDPLKNHSIEIVKNIKEYELKNELKNLFNTNESKNITLKLSPGNLGKVNIELDIKENLMQAKINVESESVKTLIQSSAGELKNSLMQNGIQLMSMSVSMNNADEKGHPKHAGKTKRKINDIAEANSYDEIQNNEQTKSLGYNTYDLIM